MMKGKTLSVGSLLIVLLACVWLWLQRTPDTPAAAEGSGALLLPALQGRIGEVTQMEIDRPGQGELQLSASSQSWKIPLPAPYTAAFYPAAPSSIGSLLRALGEARKVEAKTAKPEQHARLNLAEQGEGAATRIRLHFKGAPALELLLGSKAKEGGQLLRLAGDNQVWLTDKAIPLPADDFLGWVNRRITAVPLDDIRKIELHFLQGTSSENAGKTFSLSRKDAQQNDFQIKPLPAGEDKVPPAAQNAAARLTRLFGALNLTEVRPLSALPKEASALLSFKLSGFAKQTLSGLLSYQAASEGAAPAWWLSVQAESAVPEGWLPAGGQWVWRIEDFAGQTLAEALPKALQTPADKTAAAPR